MVKVSCELAHDALSVRVRSLDHILLSCCVDVSIFNYKPKLDTTLFIDYIFTR